MMGLRGLQFNLEEPDTCLRDSIFHRASSYGPHRVLPRWGYFILHPLQEEGFLQKGTPSFRRGENGKPMELSLS
ncbi:hypothetical protein CSW50_05035 [Thermus scotoductus]|uniref:Uncharacterized protein n=1 Tax=Thermus scotoductus TaxID=37636 RepID=A0A430R7Q0_THESC|nr:hypothetical protein CSW50_05035 [Thermus scotoductus]